MIWQIFITRTMPALSWMIYGTPLVLNCVGWSFYVELSSMSKTVPPVRNHIKHHLVTLFVIQTISRMSFTIFVIVFLWLCFIWYCRCRSILKVVKFLHVINLNYNCSLKAPWLMASASVSPSYQPVQPGAGPYRHALNSTAMPPSYVTRMTLLARGQLL